MILDCRPCNRKFRDPPGTDLITGEGLSEIESIDDSFMTSGLGVHLIWADVGAFFHRMQRFASILLGANRSKVVG